jgi:alpha-D-ribose 1-methylphosphonate 5-triphosphate diphosphatase
MSAERVLANARIVTDESVLAGALVLRDGQIAEMGEGGADSAGAEDMAGDWLLPGLVELHTDNLERLFSPRPGVRWPADAAMLIHDSQVAAAGITTVCDAVCVGFHGGKSERLDYLHLSIDVLRRARAADALKAEHFLHLRLELTDPHMLELFGPLQGEPSLRLVSLMDHTPGQRQWRDLDTYRSFSLGRDVHSEAEFQAMVARRVREQQEHGQRHRAEVLRLLDGHAAVRASHDDATPAHVDEARACGCTIAEFPTTRAAAEAARAAGMAIVMGAPNLVIGGSHSGNISAAELVGQGLLDVFSSDYVPASLLQAAFLLHEGFGMLMPQAIAPVTRTPAVLLGLTDRGSIAPGLRADLVRVRMVGTTPTVVALWREGRRIC